MKLYPEGMTATVKVPLTVTAKAKADEVKAAVKAFTTEPKEYDEIIKHLEGTVGLGGVVDVIALIDAVKTEWHPVVAEPVVIEK